MTNILAALTIGVLSAYLFYHFWIVKDGVARIMLLVFFGTTAVWALTRGTILCLIREDIIAPRTGMDIIGNINYAIYLPILFCVIYLNINRRR